MLRTLSVLLGFSCLTMTKAANPDIIVDCAYDCPLEMDACDLSGDCTRFLSYFSSSSLSTSFATSGAFKTAALTYCNNTNSTSYYNNTNSTDLYYNNTSSIDLYYNNNTNSTSGYYICDTNTVTLIDCIDSSSCWMQTTSYNSGCGYYASIVANFTVWSSVRSVQNLCNLPWDEYFDNLFGNKYVEVNVATTSSQCSNARRRTLLQSETGESGESIFSESAEFSESSESSESSSETESLINFQLTAYFYSQYSYSTFFKYVSTKTLASAFVSDGYVSSVNMYMSCLNTTCCGTSGNCTNAYDEQCNIVASTTTTTTTIPVTTRGQKSDAVLSQPFVAFNFITIIIVMICQLMF